jgi:predicted O-methyltransferase YrrM
MNLIERLYRADDRRKTRFHDQKGNLLSPTALLYTPRVFVEAVMRSRLGYRPVQPWISYRAASAIARELDRNSRVLEFGSGMSTPWFALRSGSVLSLETDSQWLERVRAALAKRGLDNVDLRLRTPENVDDLTGIADESFDFALVDGVSRHECVVAAIPKVKRGGRLYLDNTDDPSERSTEAVLLDAVRERGGEVRYFTDYVPGQMTAVQGLLARL